jgi:hypothetical protein
MKKGKDSSRVYLLIAALLVLLSSCNSPNVDSNNFPSVGVPESAMNKVIQIEDLPQFGNSYKINDCLDLHIKSLSDKTIVFPSDSQILLFAETGGDWISIENGIHDSSEFHYLPPTETFPPGLVVTVCPNISNLAQPQTIRTIIIGYYKDSEEDLVGAYLDVIIEP